jgi:hypothetical protein
LHDDDDDDDGNKYLIATKFCLIVLFIYDSASAIHLVDVLSVDGGMKSFIVKITAVLFSLNLKLFLVVV